MKNNVYEVLADYYGVGFEKPFKIKYKDTGNEYRVCFTPKGLEYEKSNFQWVKSLGFFDDLLSGVAEVVLPPFYPKLGEEYYCVEIDARFDTLEAHKAHWQATLVDYKRLAVKNVFRTFEEALEHKKIAKEWLEEAIKKYETNMC